MSLKPIEKMTFEELRREVQVLSDSLAKMKRFYEDALLNLDDDNFSSSIIKEKDGMKAQIKISAKEISTKVSTAELSSAISQTAQELRTTVVRYADTPNAIAASSQSDMTDTDAIYKMLNNSGEYVYYYYNTLTNSWTAFTDSISSVFTQTASGFKFKGGVQIDGNQVVLGNLTLGGNITWDLQNSPVKTQYSVDGSTWYDNMVSGYTYMRMSFDGGYSWSNAMKVIGTDASVTPQNVFNALTDSGAQQGIFSAFVNNGNRIYINSEYLSTRIATVANTLSIGDTAIQNEKRITLNSGTYTPVYISTVSDGISGYGALKISAISINLGSKVEIGDALGQGYLDLSHCTVSSWGNNTVPAVFG